MLTPCVHKPKSVVDESSLCNRAISMTTEQTESADEDQVMWLKTPETATECILRLFCQKCKNYHPAKEIISYFLLLIFLLLFY